MLLQHSGSDAVVFKKACNPHQLFERLIEPNSNSDLVTLPACNGNSNPILQSRRESTPEGMKTKRYRGFSTWPLLRNPGWLEHLNSPQTEAELTAIRRSVNRGSPLGGETWATTATKELGLEITTRDHDSTSGTTETQVNGSCFLFASSDSIWLSRGERNCSFYCRGITSYGSSVRSNDRVAEQRDLSWPSCRSR